MENLKYYDPHRRATWLELFFDLIFAVAISDVTHILSDTHEGHLDPAQFWKFVLIFVPLWWIWTGHTLYANRFDSDSKPHRLATLAIMFLLIVISGLIGGRFLTHYGIFVGCYFGAKAIIAVLYFLSKHKHRHGKSFSTLLGSVFLCGATISLSSVLFEAPERYVVFYLGIIFDLAALTFLTRRMRDVPVHTEHLIERVGLLTIILLGESVGSLVAALANISWSPYSLVAAATGFVMVSSIWWIYFDSFYLLTEQKLTTGHSIVYSHLFLFIGLSILASLIRHAILDDMALSDYRILAVIGTVLLFLGKQYAYFMERRELRPYLVSNTLIVFGLTGLSLLLPRIDYILMGLTATMICYVLLNFRYR
jgi:low temperature requirement protein LtrA